MIVETYTEANGKYSIPKDPNAVLDYSFDWKEWLSTTPVTPDTIASAVCAIDPPPEGNTATVQSTVVGTGPLLGIVTAWVSGGVVGQTVPLRCRITTTGGRTDDRTVYLKIKER